MSDVCDAYIYIYMHLRWASFVYVMACRLVGAKQIYLPNAEFLPIEPLGMNVSEIIIKSHNFICKNALEIYASF